MPGMDAACSSSYLKHSERVDPIQHRRRYDVFLSFRGPDVRDTFAKKLFLSLQQEGLHVFLDSERLEMGEDIGIALEEAIKETRLHIPIFSPGYATSPWCLKELSHMWRCKEACEGTHIIPLFYNVEPCHVKYLDNEKSPYAEALKKHSESKWRTKEEIDWWKAALESVSRLRGWDLAQYSDEDKLVQQVMEDLQIYKIEDLYVAKHPVGLAARTIEVVKELLGIADHQRRVTFGIWGMGGSGKTTLSKSIYNHIHRNFHASCFIADIRAMASARDLRKLQKNILKNLAKRDVNLNSVDHGKIEMQNRLTSIRALVILDDIDDGEQLDALLGDWYGPGSIIIITTREKEVLQQREVDKIHDMGGLSSEEGVKLFSWHAFGRESPQKDYEDMTQQIVHSCDGLPLSLEILGAHLCSERDLRIWEEALEKIQYVGYDKLYNSLRISYDALTFHEKQIFLDTACFFIGFTGLPRFSKEFYVKFWEVLGRKAVYTCLKKLEGKSLVVMHDGKINFEFQMHDHLRDLGRQIVEEESQDKPHFRSRLWHEEDIISAIGQVEETSTVQSIMWRGSFDLEVDSLPSMDSLKFMFCQKLLLKRKITKLPQNLRYLVLSDCKLKQNRSFSQMPKPIGQLKYLRYLYMSGTALRSLPIEFGQILSLEELCLSGCSLIKLPHSFGNLIKLKFLDICYNQLKRFPANFSQLRSLEYLGASRNQFEELSSISHLTHLHSLTTLMLYGCTSLKELPCLPPSLAMLRLKSCVKLKRMPCMCDMKNLRCLQLSCLSLDELPELEALQSLKELVLRYCDKKKLPALPSGLIHLSLHVCRNMQELPCMSHMSDLQTLDLFGCGSLKEIPNLDSMHSLRQLNLDHCDSLEKLPALPACPIHVTTDGCSKLQENKQKCPMLDVNDEDVSEKGPKLRCWDFTI